METGTITLVMKSRFHLSDSYLISISRELKELISLFYKSLQELLILTKETFKLHIVNKSFETIEITFIHQVYNEMTETTTPTTALASSL